MKIKNLHNIVYTIIAGFGANLKHFARNLHIA